LINKPTLIHVYVIGILFVFVFGCNVAFIGANAGVRDSISLKHLYVSFIIELNALKICIRQLMRRAIRVHNSVRICPIYIFHASMGHSNACTCSGALNFVSHTAKSVEFNQASYEVTPVIR
jgi:hypothetical protein